MTDDIEILRRRWDETLRRTDAAVRRQPDAYRTLETLLNRVCGETIDISEYYKLAQQMAAAVERLKSAGAGTIFDAFHTDIDPTKGCTARYFRFICMDLQNLIREFEAFRRSRRHLKIIK